MKKSTTIIEFINDINFLLDKGITYSVEEVDNHIENKNVIDWLEEEFQFGTENGLDFSPFREAERKFLHSELESWYIGYAGQEGCKWGIENNGLCILIGWSLGILREVTKDKDDKIM